MTVLRRTRTRINFNSSNQCRLPKLAFFIIIISFAILKRTDLSNWINLSSVKIACFICSYEYDISTKLVNTSSICLSREQSFNFLFRAKKGDRSGWLTRGLQLNRDYHYTMHRCGVLLDISGLTTTLSILARDSLGSYFFESRSD